MSLALNVDRSAQNPGLIDDDEIVVGMDLDAVGGNIGQAVSQIQGGVEGDIAHAVGDVHGAASGIVGRLDRGLQVYGIVVEYRGAGNGAARGVGQHQGSSARAGNNRAREITGLWGAWRRSGVVARSDIDVGAAILKPRIDSYGDAGEGAVAINPVMNSVDAAEAAGGERQRVAGQNGDRGRASRVGFVGERTVVGGEGGRRWRGHDGLDAVAKIDYAAAEAASIAPPTCLQTVRHAGFARGHAVLAPTTSDTH